MMTTENAHRKKVLLVDDAKEIQDLVKFLLQNEFNVDISASLAEAAGALQRGIYDLVILDLMLPDGLGFDFCKKVEEMDIPVVILSARRDTPDKITGYGLGAEDYIEKPFDNLEFKARIEARIRKSEKRKAMSLNYHIGNLEFLPDVQLVNIESQNAKANLELTPIEFKLLLALAKKPGKIFSRAELIQVVRQDNPHMVERGIDAHISRIRRKLTDHGKNDLLRSAYGAGYFFKA